MRLLLTRPVEDSRRLARLLAERGHEILIDPLLAIEPVPVSVTAPNDVQAVLLTSRHAAPALPAALARHPVFAVGEATARAARQHGAVDVRTGPGDAAALARLVVGQLAPSAGGLLHLAGSTTRPEPRRTLEAAGFRVVTALAYRSVAATSLADATLTALEGGGIDAVLLFSPRTAALFATLAVQAVPAATLGAIRLVCLSEEVASACRALGGCVVVATRPDEAALLDLLDGPTHQW